MLIIMVPRFRGELYNDSFVPLLERLRGAFERGLLVWVAAPLELLFQSRFSQSGSLELRILQAQLFSTVGILFCFFEVATGRSAPWTPGLVGSDHI
ncbi:hypothetical protein [Pararhizobium sp. PWRC1-1]|uniref:hypothetical protein n=1 Tax=Pararhizobium sp. PWRC1-1 TaxID=2804566 RepID=UPI003CF03303